MPTVQPVILAAIIIVNLYCCWPFITRSYYYYYLYDYYHAPGRITFSLSLALAHTLSHV